MTAGDHALCAIAWIAFGWVHSATAGATFRSGLGRIFGRGHRLAYNALALAQFAAVIAVGAWVGQTAAAFAMPAPVLVVQYAMLAAGAILGIAALRSYRAGPFLGWAQFSGDDDDSQPLVTDALHARMRHPLYTAVLLILWGGVRGELGLATAAWGSLYLLIGSLFEERRLVARYGDAYQKYRSTTPRFLPRLL